MRRLVRVMGAGGALLLLAGAVVLMWGALQPTPHVEVMPIALEVVVPQPLTAADFPADMPPGTMLDGRRKPVPGEVVPGPVDADVFAAWKVDWLARLDHTTEVCGVEIEVACTDQACAVHGRSSALLGYVRRPMRLFEELLHHGVGMPEEVDQCGTAASRLNHETEIMRLTGGGVCQTFDPRQAGDRSPVGDAHGAALCRHFDEVVPTAR